MKGVLDQILENRIDFAKFVAPLSILDLRYRVDETKFIQYLEVSLLGTDIKTDEIVHDVVFKYCKYYMPKDFRFYESHCNMVKICKSSKSLIYKALLEIENTCKFKLIIKLKL